MRCLIFAHAGSVDPSLRANLSVDDPAKFFDGIEVARSKAQAAKADGSYEYGACGKATRFCSNCLHLVNSKNPENAKIFLQYHSINESVIASMQSLRA